MIKTFSVVLVSYYDELTGFFRAKTSDGESLLGYCISPPYGTIVAEVNPSKDGRGWYCQSIRYNNLEDVTESILAAGLVKGIRESKAESVFQTFKGQIWSILDAAVEGKPVNFKGKLQDPSEVLQKANGVGKVVAAEMIESWREGREKFLSYILAIQCGLSVWQFKEILEHDRGGTFYKMVYNIEPFSVYDLMSFGVPWEKVDQIAQEEWENKPALPKDSPIRYAGAVKRILADFRKEGHICAPVADINRLCESAIGIANIVEYLGDLRPFGIHLYADSVYDRHSYQLEVDLSWHISRLIRGEARAIKVSDEEIRLASDVSLNEEQVLAIQQALSSKVSIITGGPGTGKTTILRTLCEILDDHGVEKRLCAFTGAAARRMSLATGQKAETMHSMFRLFQPKEERLFVSGGVVVIDEMSTNSQSLLRGVLAQLGDAVRVVLIGDADQLPPVGAGEPFVQLLESSSIPHTRLQHIYRNRGAIAQACYDVNHGIMPTPDNETFFLEQVSEDRDIPATLLNVIKFVNSKGWGIPQGITPLNSRPGVGRESINKSVQSLVNPSGKSIPGTDIRVGDVVVQLKNNYELDVRNGMVGRCIEQSEESMVSRNLLPATQMLTVLFEDEDKSVVYTKADLPELALGYAVTVHKAQGNQFPAVIVIIPSLPPPLAMRQIVYTAMSRAQNRLFVIARRGAMEECIKNETMMRRHSHLADFVDESIKETEIQDYEEQPVW